MRIAPTVTITEAQARQLQAWARGRSVQVRLAQRAQMILLAAQGMTDQAIAAELKVGRRTPARWRQRFLEQGPVGIERDAPRPGRKRQISAAKVRAVISKTTREVPANSTHWSTRTMAAAVGISEASVRRIWHANGLKPHPIKTFKVSNDKRFAEKLEDIVGLYLNPPEHALVLCCDEKSQIQALDRTQPGLPLKKGRAQTLTHDYKRNGTTTLAVCRTQYTGRCRHRPVPATTSSSGVVEVPAPDRTRNPTRARFASDRRQPCHP